MISVKDPERNIGSAQSVHRAASKETRNSSPTKPSPSAFGGTVKGEYGILINNGYSLKRIKPEGILYVESDGKKCIINMVDGTHHHVACLLGEMEDILPSTEFVRIHKRYIIAVKHIDAITGNYVKLESGDSLPIGLTFGVEKITDYFPIIGLCRKKD